MSRIFRIFFKQQRTQIRRSHSEFLHIKGQTYPDSSDRGKHQAGREKEKADLDPSTF